MAESVRVILEILLITAKLGWQLQYSFLEYQPLQVKVCNIRFLLSGLTLV